MPFAVKRARALGPPPGFHKDSKPLPSFRYILDSPCALARALRIP